MEGSPSNCSTVTVSDHVKAQMLHSSASDDALDHILQYMGRSGCKQETKPAAMSASSAAAAAALEQHLSTPQYGKFMKLPPPSPPATATCGALRGRCHRRYTQT